MPHWPAVPSHPQPSTCGTDRNGRVLVATAVVLSAANLLFALTPTAAIRSQHGPHPIAAHGASAALALEDARGASPAPPAIADVKHLASLERRDRWSSEPLADELVHRIEQRRPNVCLCVSGALLNRLLSQPINDVQPVRRQTSRAHVVGRRETNTRLSVRLIPAADWRLRVIANGQIAADTTAYASQATFFVGGAGRFKSTKTVILDGRQVKLSPAEANAQFNLSLNGYQTSMDAVPLFRHIARDTALSRFQQQLAASRQQVQTEVQEQAKQQLDQRTEAFLSAAQAQLEINALGPLRSLGLSLAPKRLETTENRMLGDFLLTGADHMAPSSPQPELPADSLVSVQLHHSAVNNLLDSLRLHGKCENVPGLCEKLCALFGAAELPQLPGAAENVVLHFSEQRPLRVDFDERRAVLVLRLAAFALGEKRWSNLTVRCVYQIGSTSPSAPPIRVDNLSIESDSLNPMDRIVLQGVFGKVFSSAADIPAPAKYLAKYLGGQDVAVTQCHAKDGWLTLTIGERQSRVLRRDALGTSR